jgi:NAD(P)H dehydrogenase (quinone)
MVPPPVAHRLVLTHPDPSSFCAAIARRWQDRVGRNHQACEMRDLYREGFDPVLKASEQPGKAGYAPLAENLAECRRLQDLDVLVFVYPVWFGTPPAMLKGYLERVVGSGVTFTAGGQDRKPLADVRLVQISTSASSEPWLAEKGIPSALHTIFDRYISDVFGTRKTYRLHLDSITQGLGEHEAAMSLAQVDELADRVCAEANADRWERDRTG